MDQQDHMVSPEALDAAIRAQFPDAIPEAHPETFAARHFHDQEQFRTQNGLQNSPTGDVLVIVKPPDYIEKRTSCNGAPFKEARLRLDYDAIVKTGSTDLIDKLQSAKYQNRMRRRINDISEGVTHVLDLSPSLEEDDCSLALQDLTITKGIKLWYRTMYGAESVSARLVGGHDDVCFCRGESDVVEALPNPIRVTPMMNLQSPQSSSSLEESKDDCIYDMKPLAVYRDINDYCPIRQAANTIRLFRAIAGEDLLIDSAPRMWTLVGLFKMFGMTNHDLLRDSITAWLMADPNSMFMEILPEETLHVATVLESQAIAEPAYRILVNERAIAVAGEQLTRQHLAQTVFGRRSSDCLSGSEFGDSVLRMVEHAGVAMADRVRTAVDRLLSDECFSVLGIQEWKKLLAVGFTIKQIGLSQDLPFVKALGVLIEGLRYSFHTDVYDALSDVLPPGSDIFADRVRRHYISPVTMLSFRDVYKFLKEHQRALTPYFWQQLSNKPAGWLKYKSALGPTHSLESLTTTFNKELRNALEPAGISIGEFHLYEFHTQLTAAVRRYIAPYIKQEGQYLITPHLLLTLNDEEMNFLRLGSEAVFDDNVPPTWMGPSGPGPAYHTGQTIGSVSGSSTTSFGMGKLAIDDDDDDTDRKSVV